MAPDRVSQASKSSWRQAAQANSLRRRTVELTFSASGSWLGWPYVPGYHEKEQSGLKEIKCGQTQEWFMDSKAGQWKGNRHISDMAANAEILGAGLCAPPAEEATGNGLPLAAALAPWWKVWLPHWMALLPAPCLVGFVLLWDIQCLYWEKRKICEKVYRNTPHSTTLNLGGILTMTPLWPFLVLATAYRKGFPYWNPTASPAMGCWRTAAAGSQTPPPYSLTLCQDPKC